MNWQDNLVTQGEQVRQLLANTRTIAVLGIKTEAQSNQPAFYVPNYLASAGFEVIPVPVYYPNVTTILGREVFRKLVDIPVDVDMVNVFRRSEMCLSTLTIYSPRNLKRSGCNPELQS